MPLSSSLEFLRSRTAKTAACCYALACVALLLFTVGRNGLGEPPYEEYRIAAQNPFVSLRDVGGPEVNNYFQQSPLLPLVAYGTRLTSRPAFVALCLATVALGFAAFAALAKVRYGRETGLIATALVLAHPVFLVMISWLGTPDGIAFLLMACLLFARRGWWIAGLCALGAFNHPVMVFAAPVAILLRATAREEGFGFGKLLWAAAGLALGTGAVYAFLGYYHISVFSRLDCIGTRTFAGWVQMNLSHLPLTLWSLHGVVWLALVGAVIAAWRLDRRYFLVFIGCQVLLYAVTFTTEDTTRVFSMLSWAGAVHCVIHAAKLLEAKGLEVRRSRYLGALAAIAILGLVIPRCYLWAGNVQAPNFSGFWHFVGRAVS